MKLPEKFVLWGSSGHAKVLADLIALRGSSVVALFDNDPQVQSSIPNVPMCGNETGLRNWLSLRGCVAGMGAALAIGGARGRDRQALALLLRQAGFSLPTLSHPSAVVSETARLGDACQILANAVVAADVCLGDVCIVNNGAIVDHECILGSGVHLAPGATLCGCVNVGKYVMVGAGAVILPRIIIGEGAVVGAGAVVNRNVPAGAVVVGNPGRVI
jgi:sugar O-acyltransferase (sialic acid O-acetyltransferase NeuD family)